MMRRQRVLKPWMFLGLALLATADAAGAQPVDVPDTWGGDTLSRPRLTGDWAGLRDELGERGAVFDMIC
jgi:porin